MCKNALVPNPTTVNIYVLQTTIDLAIIRYRALLYTWSWDYAWISRSSASKAANRAIAYAHAPLWRA